MAISLLILGKYGVISTFKWDIFLKIFGDIPGMLFHHFQIILNFLCVCQSVSWLTSLLKLDKYRYISSSGWDIFLKFFGDIPGMLIHYFQIILKFLCVCHSVRWLTYLLKLDKYRDISSSGWVLSDFFKDIPGMLVHLLKMILNIMYVCQSVCLLTSYRN